MSTYWCLASLNPNVYAGLQLIMEIKKHIVSHVQSLCFCIPSFFIQTYLLLQHSPQYNTLLNKQFLRVFWLGKQWLKFILYWLQKVVSCGNVDNFGVWVWQCHVSMLAVSESIGCGIGPSKLVSPLHDGVRYPISTQLQTWIIIRFHSWLILNWLIIQLIVKSIDLSIDF